MNLDNNEHVLYSNPALCINVNRISFPLPQGYRAQHFHREAELVRVESGSLLCRVEGAEYTLNEGQIALIGGNVLHQLVYNGAPCQITYMQIDLQPYIYQLFPHSNHSLNAFLSQGNLLKYHVYCNDGELAKAIETIERELKQQTAYFELYAKTAVFQIISFMYRAGFLANELDLYNQAEVQRLLPAVTYAEQNFSSRIGLTEVSRLINTDKFYFCKLFKELTGATFMDYVNYLRLTHAKKLLIESDNTVAEITFCCGFSSIQFFNKTFKQNVGYTPKQYRQNGKTKQ